MVSKILNKLSEMMFICNVPTGIYEIRSKSYSRSFKVICFDVDEKPLGDCLLRHNNFGFIYEL